MSEKLVNGIIGAFGGLTAIAFGKEILVFETMDLEMTDGQIEKSLKKINTNEFGINIVKDKLGNKPYYKIYLIEANIGS